MRRERLARVEGSHQSSNSSSISHGSKSSSYEHHDRRGSLPGDFDSNVSSQSESSIIHHEAVTEQLKHCDQKRRQLVVAAQLPSPQFDLSPMVKRVGLDDTIDAFIEKAQAKRDEDEEAITNGTMDDRHE